MEIFPVNPKLNLDFLTRFEKHFTGNLIVFGCFFGSNLMVTNFVKITILFGCRNKRGGILLHLPG